MFPALGTPEQCTGQKVGIDYLLDPAILLDDDELLLRAAESDECFEGVSTTEGLLLQLIMSTH